MSATSQPVQCQLTLDSSVLDFLFDEGDDPSHGANAAAPALPNLDDKVAAAKLMGACMSFGTPPPSPEPIEPPEQPIGNTPRILNKIPTAEKTQVPLREAGGRSTTPPSSPEGPSMMVPPKIRANMGPQRLPPRQNMAYSDRMMYKTPSSASDSSVPNRGMPRQYAERPPSDDMGGGGMPPPPPPNSTRGMNYQSPKGQLPPQACDNADNWRQVADVCRQKLMVARTRNEVHAASSPSGGPESSRIWMSTNIIPGSPQPENMPNDDNMATMCYQGQDCYQQADWGPQNDGLCDDWNIQMIPNQRMNNNWMDGSPEEMGSTSFPISSPRRVSGGQQRQQDWGPKNSNKVRFRCPPNQAKMMMMHDERPGSVGFDFGRNDDPYGKDPCGMQHGMQCNDGDDGEQEQREMNYPKNSSAPSSSPIMTYPPPNSCNNPPSPTQMGAYPSPGACTTPRSTVSPSMSNQMRTPECDYPSNINEGRRNSPNDAGDLGSDMREGTSPKMQQRSPMPPQVSSEGDASAKDGSAKQGNVDGNWNEGKNDLSDKNQDDGEWNKKNECETEEDLVVKQWQQQRIALPPEVMEQWQQQLEQMEQTPGYRNLTTAQRQQVHYQTQQQLLTRYQEQQRKNQQQMQHESQDQQQQQHGGQRQRQKYNRGEGNNNPRDQNQGETLPNMQEQNTRYGQYLNQMQQQRSGNGRRQSQDPRPQQQPHYQTQYPPMQHDRKNPRLVDPYQEANRDMIPPAGRMANNGYPMNYPMNPRQMQPPMGPDIMGNYQMPMGPPHPGMNMRHPDMQPRSNMPPPEHYQQGRPPQNYQYMPNTHPQSMPPREHPNQFSSMPKREFYPYPQPPMQQQQMPPQQQQQQQQAPPQMRQNQQIPPFPSQGPQGYPQGYYQNTLRGFGAQPAASARPVGWNPLEPWPPQSQQPPMPDNQSNAQNENYRTPRESVAQAQYGDRSEAPHVEEAYVKRDTTPQPPISNPNPNHTSHDQMGNEAAQQQQIQQQMQQQQNDQSGKTSESGTQQKLESLPQGQKRIEYIIQQLRQNMGPGQQQQLQQLPQPQQQQPQQQQSQLQQSFQVVQPHALPIVKTGNEDCIDKVQIHNPEVVYKQDSTKDDQELACAGGNSENLSQRLADVLAEAERVMRQCKGTQEALWNDLATRDRNFVSEFSSWTGAGPNAHAGPSNQVKTSWSDAKTMLAPRGRSPTRRDDESVEGSRSYPRSPRSRSRHHHSSPPETVPLTTAEGGDGDMFSTPTQDLRALVGDLNSRILMIRERCLNQLGTEQRTAGQDPLIPIPNAFLPSDVDVDGGISVDSSQVLENKKPGGGGSGSGGNSLVNPR